MSIKLTKHKSFTESMFPSFNSFSEAIYEGNEPAGLGHRHISGGICDCWSCKWGGGESFQGELLFGDFKLNKKLTVYIAYDVLWIVDIRHSCKCDVWEYSSNPEKLKMNNLQEKFIHQLEPDKIDEILNIDIDCKFWKMVQRKAKELYVPN